MSSLPSSGVAFCGADPPRVTQENARIKRSSPSPYPLVSASAQGFTLTEILAPRLGWKKSIRTFGHGSDVEH